MRCKWDVNINQKSVLIRRCVFGPILWTNCATESKYTARSREADVVSINVLIYVSYSVFNDNGLSVKNDLRTD